MQIRKTASGWLWKRHNERHFPPWFWTTQVILFLSTVVLNPKPVSIFTVTCYMAGSILWARAAYHWGQVRAYREMREHPTWQEVLRLNRELEELHSQVDA